MWEQVVFHPWDQHPQDQGRQHVGQWNGPIRQLPCLVSDIPGNKDWIEDGVNGWTFRDGDVDDLAEKIRSAIKNRKSFKKIGEAARKTAEERADWKKNFGKLLEAYEIIKLQSTQRDQRKG